jgi:hypothetical protein
VLWLILFKSEAKAWRDFERISSFLRGFSCLC